MESEEQVEPNLSIFRYVYHEAMVQVHLVCPYLAPAGALHKCPLPFLYLPGAGHISFLGL